jgi:hypothetical protein
MKFFLLTLMLIPSLLYAGALPPKGTLSFTFKLDETLYPSVLPGQPDRPRIIPLIKTPLFNLRLDANPRVVMMDLELERITDKGPLPRNLTRTMLNHLKGGQWYHLACSWDVETNRFDLYLNGTLQEHISNIQIPYWEDGVPPLSGEVTLFPAEGIEFGEVSVIPEVGEGEALPPAIAAKAAEGPPMKGEGRTLYEGELDLEGLQNELIFEAAFDDPENIQHEKELFEDGRRARQPSTDWLTEATGTARIENGALILESQPEVELQRWENGAPVWEPGLHQKHVVVWLTKRMPDNILVEYTMEPVDSQQGLHILFFSARGPDNGSIFQPGLKAREGDFRNYIFNPDEFQSYHISWWSSPQTADRRSSNLRKNNNFYLLTAGDDRINRKGEKPYRIRLLKQGGRIQGEVDGVKVIDYLDEGTVFGPVFTDGYLGLRMMGESKQITIRDFKVWRVSK